MKATLTQAQNIFIFANINNIFPQRNAWNARHGDVLQGGHRKDEGPAW